MELKRGDIASVQFGNSKSTKTLAMIERVHVVLHNPSDYDVLYNDGTRGTGCPREIFGDPIASDDVITLLRHTFRHLENHELFQHLITLREASIQHLVPSGIGVTTGPY